MANKGAYKKAIFLSLSINLSDNVRWRWIVGSKNGDLPGSTKWKLISLLVKFGDVALGRLLCCGWIWSRQSKWVVLLGNCIVWAVILLGKLWSKLATIWCRDPICQSPSSGGSPCKELIRSCQSCAGQLEVVRTEEALCKKIALMFTFCSLIRCGQLLWGRDPSLQPDDWTRLITEHQIHVQHWFWSKHTEQQQIVVERDHGTCKCAAEINALKKVCAAAAVFKSDSMGDADVTIRNWISLQGQEPSVAR